MNNAAIVEMKLAATVQTVERKDLSIYPKMQMRTEMNQTTITEYAENIETILELHPIDVVAVTENGRETWYVVDGFHRYHAAAEAELGSIKINLMSGTYEHAVQYAMTANFKNGMRPNPNDVKRCIPQLLETAPDFEYDSKEVNKWVCSFGVPASTARNHTSDLIEAVKAKRDAEIVRLDAEGKTQREIAGVIGFTAMQVGRILKEIAVTKCPEDKMLQDDTPIASTEAPWDTDSDEGFFDETECDATPAINPADAFQQELDAHEAERQETTQLQDNSASTLPVIITDESNIKSESHLIGVLNQLRAIRNSDTYAEQLSALVDNDADYAQSLIKTALLFSEDLEAADSI